MLENLEEAGRMAVGGEGIEHELADIALAPAILPCSRTRAAEEGVSRRFGHRAAEMVGQ
jgi:hypothetical protein